MRLLILAATVAACARSAPPTGGGEPSRADGSTAAAPALAHPDAVPSSTAAGATTQPTVAPVAPVPSMAYTLPPKWKTTDQALVSFADYILLRAHATHHMINKQTGFICYWGDVEVTEPKPGQFAAHVTVETMTSIDLGDTQARSTADIVILGFRPAAGEFPWECDESDVTVRKGKPGTCRSISGLCGGERGEKNLLERPSGANPGVALPGAPCPIQCPAAALGYEKRLEVVEVLDFIAHGESSLAKAALDDIIGSFERRTSDSRTTYVSVRDNDELARFRKSAEGRKARKIVWIDWAYGEALLVRASMLDERRDFASAIGFLDRAAALQPYEEAAHIERGFALGQLRQSDDAIASYRRALELAHDPKVRAMALRGIGSSYIDKGDLELARQAFEESKTLDPDSPVAANELHYIDTVEQKQKRKEQAAPP